MLLDPNEIKEDKKESKDQSQRLIRALAEEEARINKEVSLLKEESEIEKDRITRETEAYIESQKEKVKIMDAEVLSLEARRKEALKPIDEMKKEIEQARIEVKQALETLETEKRDIDTKHEENLDYAEKLHDKEADLNERIEKVTERERIVGMEENRVKDSANTLADKWVAFHTRVNVMNIDLENRENKVLAREKVLDIRQEELEKRDVLQTNRAKQIKDQYATLARTIEESKKKYNI